MIGNNKITVMVEARVNAPLEMVWELWTNPTHICHWNFANEDWHTPFAETDLREGGAFLFRMEARDGSLGFDFSGTFERLREFQSIEYVLTDGRNVWVEFQDYGEHVEVVEWFEAEDTFPVEMQRSGWQAILDNFKRYAEALAESDGSALS